MDTVSRNTEAMDRLLKIRCLASQSMVCDASTEQQRTAARLIQERLDVYFADAFPIPETFNYAE